MTIQSLNGYPAGTPLPKPNAGPPPAVASDTVKATEVPVQQASAQATRKQVEQAVEQIRTAMSAKASALEFSLDDQTGDTIVRVVDSETGEVIRQIPSKEMLEIAQAIDKMQGMLLRQSA